MLASRKINRDMSHALCNLGPVSKVGILLCALAVLTVQVPLLACDSDCQALLVSVAADHKCHTPGAHSPCAGHHHHGSGIGHAGCHSDAPDHGTEHPDGGEHEVIQVAAVSAGVRLTLPAHSVQGRMVMAVVATAQLPSSGISWEASYARDSDPIAVPPPASVRLLL